VTWARTKGRYDIALNYTYGEALGIVEFFNQFNITNNYGVPPGNWTQIFNAACSIELVNPTKSRLGGGRERAAALGHYSSRERREGYRQLADPLFGTATQKQGNRVVQFMVKVLF
jgi:hypothetical protein